MPSLRRKSQSPNRYAVNPDPVLSPHSPTRNDPWPSCWRKLCGCMRLTQPAQPPPPPTYHCDDERAFESVNFQLIDRASSSPEKIKQQKRGGPTVIDVGSYYWRFGDAYSTGSPTRWRSRAGRVKPTLSEDTRLMFQQDDIIVGDDKVKSIPEALVDLTPVVDHGDASFVEDWDAVTALILASKMSAAGLFAAPLGVGRPTDREFTTFAESLLEIAFEGAPAFEAVAISSAMPLPLFAVGRTHGVALQVGHHRSVVANICAGVAKNDNYKVFNRSGGINALQRFALPDGSAIVSPDDDIDVVELVFGDPKDHDKRRNSLSPTGSTPIAVRAYDLTKTPLAPVQVVAEFAWNEVTQSMTSLRNVDVPPAPVEVLVSGGATLLPGFSDALEAKVRSAAIARALVTLSPRAGRLHPDDRIAFLPADDDAANWRGAAILASSAEFTNWLLKHDYDDIGARRAAASFAL